MTYWRQYSTNEINEMHCLLLSQDEEEDFSEDEEEIEDDNSYTDMDSLGLSWRDFF